MEKSKNSPGLKRNREGLKSPVGRLTPDLLTQRPTKSFGVPESPRALEVSRRGCVEILLAGVRNVRRCGPRPHPNVTPGYQPRPRPQPQPQPQLQPSIRFFFS